MKDKKTPLSHHGATGCDLKALMGKCYVYMNRYALNALETFGSYQRPVFSLGVFQHTSKITNL